MKGSSKWDKGELPGCTSSQAKVEMRPLPQTHTHSSRIQLVCAPSHAASVQHLDNSSFRFFTCAFRCLA